MLLRSKSSPKFLTTFLGFSFKFDLSFSYDSSDTSFIELKVGQNIDIFEVLTEIFPYIDF